MSTLFHQLDLKICWKMKIRYLIGCYSTELYQFVQNYTNCTKCKKNDILQLCHFIHSFHFQPASSCQCELPSVWFGWALFHNFHQRCQRQIVEYKSRQFFLMLYKFLWNSKSVWNWCTFLYFCSAKFQW